MLHNTDNRSIAPAAMVALLPLLLIPLVISSFLLVYALVGLVLEGDSLARWRSESWSVAWPTAAVQSVICVCIIAYARYRRLALCHVLNWSSMVNIALVCALVTLVYSLSFPA